MLDHMFKVTISTVGKTKEKWLEIALGEYQQRLSSTLTFEWKLFETEEALDQALLSTKGYIALHPKGQLFTSEELSHRLFLKWGKRPHFVIGGANGLSSKAIENAALSWSLSPLTFTHQITRLLLAEQLYRALEIEKNSGYHR